MKTILLLLLIVIPLVSATVCSDKFESTDEIISICGYCNELDGSICLPATGCNFTIYDFDRNLYAENLVATNNLDGTFEYNISQFVDGIKNLSDGKYFGEMFCGNRSRDDLTFYTEEYYCAEKKDCTTADWEADKQEQIDEHMIYLDKVEQLTGADDKEEEESFFGWVIRKIKELFTRTDTLEAELCKKDNSYSFCGGVTPQL